MEVAEHIAALRREGALLAAAAATAGPDAAVPTCPGWTVRDLVRHTGGVHRWAATHVREARRQHVDGELEDLVGGWPTDADLVDWYRAEHAALVGALEQAPPDLDCFTFLPAPSPLAMWARRQGHETAIHRVDAELAAGRDLAALTPIPAEHAADGIDELLTGFVPRRRTGLTANPARVLAVHAVDAARWWRVEIGAEGTRASRVDATDPDRGVDAAGSTVAGAAHDLDLLLWSRAPASIAQVGGDPGVLDLFLDRVHVRWS